MPHVMPWHAGAVAGTHLFALVSHEKSVGHEPQEMPWSSPHTMPAHAGTHWFALVSQYV
jgi:hypothetical protein